MRSHKNQGRRIAEQEGLVKLLKQGLLFWQFQGGLKVSLGIAGGIDSIGSGARAA